MNFISRLILNLIIIFLFSILIFIAPLPFLLNSQSTKSMLHQINIYEKTAPIISANMAQTIADDQGKLSQFIQENSDRIIAPEFISNIAEALIDETFRVINTYDNFQDLEINTLTLKNNFLQILSTSSDIDAKNLAIQIPDYLFISDLFNIRKDTLDVFSDFLIENTKLIKLTFFAASALLLFTLIFYLFFNSLPKLLNSLSLDFIIIGLIFFATHLIYRFFILSPKMTEFIIAKADSNLMKAMIVICLHFISNLTKTYSIIGLILFSLAVLTKILLYYKGISQNKLHL